MELFVIVMSIVIFALLIMFLICVTGERIIREIEASRRIYIQARLTADEWIKLMRILTDAKEYQESSRPAKDTRESDTEAI